jgi:hypothetical protein
MVVAGLLEEEAVVHIAVQERLYKLFLVREDTAF